MSMPWIVRSHSVTWFGFGLLVMLALGCEPKAALAPVGAAAIATSMIERSSIEQAPVELPAVQNVILITIDTLRADHLGSFGYPIDTSPWLDDMAAHGISFKRAYSHSSTTRPSHSSLFTSLYPIEHGVSGNRKVLSDDFLTMAEMMRASGFQTAGFVSAAVPLGGDMNQGFEHWDSSVDLDREAKPKLKYRPAEDTVDRALAWLENEAASDRPLFLWVHLYDPHNPLLPPDEVHDFVRDEAASLGDAYGDLLEASGIRKKKFPAVVQYDSEIRYADRQLARLESSLEALGLNRDALWIVTADHGQGLGAHDWWGHHLQIYNAHLHVPLVFRFTSGALSPREVGNELVSHVDVLPTLAEIVGGDLSEQSPPVRGRSLVPLLAGTPSASSRTFTFAQRREIERQKARNAYERGSRFSLQSLDFKYLLFTEGEDEFYDLRSDPYEKTNLIDSPQHQREAERFRVTVQSLVDEAVKTEAESRSTKRERAQLRALGYGD